MLISGMGLRRELALLRGVAIGLSQEVTRMSFTPCSVSLTGLDVPA
jgi:hypothetical protein